ncbi:hypothetical protein [Agrococcus jejuensis]|uniref:PH domain-containing protein n=1 Tax=Agrococcus jejuensis TaxID=399736 RepID=A0A1G8FKE7_9MICO|nr:hypothetical protein [Agrococcus jejuensis]SDH82509.1 hypothetical protein SAMN04489720_2511 [Agrococcus jejuensis]
MPANLIDVRGAVRHLFASRFAAALAGLGFVILAIGIAIGPLGAIIGLPVLGLLAWQSWRIPRRRLVVDAPGPDARLRHGPLAQETVALADVAGGIVQRTAGATTRGIRTGADVERWVLVGRDGLTVARIDGRGFAADDLRAVRRALPGTWMSLHEARMRALVPADAPWDVRHPRAAVAIGVAASLATVAVLVLGFLGLTSLGAPALLWPWWR